MTTQNDINILLGIEPPSEGKANVVPVYLEEHYARLAAIENLKAAREENDEALAALAKTTISNEDEEIREAALSALCEISSDNKLKKTILYIASTDASESVLSTALEQAALHFPELAKKMALRLQHHPDQSISTYSIGILAI
ncbi:hypothetical protein RE428_44580 [Marinobacter nanhaiticus D15-8W]|uniref:HEAT repeat domain-containing protein n=1 Tax=Marinobacter nanhaiticus D15-8W TaxID=626887 RepID=N6X3T1_9GAMM|nr:hypothetical protein [Marinobacter nanhaiticus]ENO15703.1 hypothetical protein J057_10141 [Marinobacter nanhaiticus D15-8W]BES73440.1 hypothetical protein RE428_44580 [Marinobacter nanhaiticus D15-8W]